MWVLEEDIVRVSNDGAMGYFPHQWKVAFPFVRIHHHLVLTGYSLQFHSASPAFEGRSILAVVVHDHDPHDPSSQIAPN